MAGDGAGTSARKDGNYFSEMTSVMKRRPGGRGFWAGKQQWPVWKGWEAASGWRTVDMRCGGKGRREGGKERGNEVKHRGLLSMGLWAEVRLRTLF